MIIAKCGDFYITHEIFLGTRKLTTKTIELCKKIENKSFITIAKINNNNDLQSINSRLIDYIETQEDLQNVKKLIKILYNIYETDEMELE